MGATRVRVSATELEADFPPPVAPEPKRLAVDAKTDQAKRHMRELDEELHS